VIKAGLHVQPLFYLYQALVMNLVVGFDGQVRKSKCLDDWDLFGLFCLALADNVKRSFSFCVTTALEGGIRPDSLVVA